MAINSNRAAQDNGLYQNGVGEGVVHGITGAIGADIGYGLGGAAGMIGAGAIAGAISKEGVKAGIGKAIEGGQSALVEALHGKGSAKKIGMGMAGLALATGATALIGGLVGGYKDGRAGENNHSSIGLGLTTGLIGGAGIGALGVNLLKKL